MDLPGELVARLTGYALQPVHLGESGAAVYRCSAEQLPGRYLKVGALAAALRLRHEAERLRWMKAHGLAVPAVCEYGVVDKNEYLLLEEIQGLAASDPSWLALRSQVVTALGEALAALHLTDIRECPFDHRIARQIEAARVRIAAGHVDEADFDEGRRGCAATSLFAKLVASVPDHEDLVFAHGDYCLPNVILHRSAAGDARVSGFIDCGRAGIADRYQDIALAIRSISFNFGDSWVDLFLSAYGLPGLEADKVAFFTLLDEFF